MLSDRKSILILKKSPVKVEDKATQDGNSNNKYSVEKENIVNKAQTTNDKSQNNKFIKFICLIITDILFIWIGNVNITSNKNVAKITESDSKLNQTFCHNWKSLHTNTWNNDLIENEGYNNNNNTVKLRNYSQNYTNRIFLSLKI